MKKRKWTAALLATALTVSMLAGCASSAPSQKDTQNAAQPTNKDNGTVSLTVWAEESTHDALNQMVESFKKEYEGQANFEITLEQNSDDKTRERVLDDVYAAADVFIMADDQLASMAAGGALYPVPNATEVKAANVEGSVEAATINDTLYAYPMTEDNGYFLYCNKKYLTDKDVETMDGILKVAKENGKKFTMDWSSGWYLYSFFGNTGLDFGINDDNVTNHCEWNTTEGEIKGTDIAQALLDIQATGAFESVVDNDFIAGVKDGSVIAGVSGVWDETQLKSVWGDDLGAVMLADWLTNEQNQTLRFEMNGQGPSNTKAADSDEVKQAPAIQAVITQSEFGKLQRVGNTYWDACTKFGNIMAKGNKDNVKLQKLMDTLVEEITKSVAG